MSPTGFNEVEAAKIAQQMEHDGLAFYRAFAETTGDPAVRRVFEQIAQDEVDHLKAFQALEEALQAERREAGGYADDPDLQAYVGRLLDMQVFADERDVAALGRRTETDYEALAVAMRAERDAIVFYQEMLDLVASDTARETFQWILEQEREHLRLLGDRSEHCETLEG